MNSKAGTPEKPDLEAKKTEAEALLEKNDNEGAIKIYRELIDTYPENASIHSDIGLVYYNQGDTQNAEKAFKEALRLDDSMLETWFNLGCLYQDRGAFSEALMFYKEVINRNKEDAPTFVRMGLCAENLNQIEDARAFWHEAFRLQPNSLETGTMLARAYIQDGDLPQAEEILKVTAISHPDEISLHQTLGLIQKEQGKYESALAQFNKVVGLNEGHAEAFYHLGACCAALGMDKQAEPFFAKAFKLDQSFMEPLLELGHLYRRKKKNDAAVAMYEKWVEMVEGRQLTQDEQIKNILLGVCTFISVFYSSKKETDRAAYWKSKISQETSDEPLDDNLDISLRIGD